MDEIVWLHWEDLTQEEKKQARESYITIRELEEEIAHSIVANVTAATAVLIMVYNILTHGENNAMQTDFSTRTIRMQTVLEKKTRRRAA